MGGGGRSFNKQNCENYVSTKKKVKFLSSVLKQDNLEPDKKLNM